MSWVERIRDRIQGKAPPGARRSPHWRDIRRRHLKREPECQVCGGRKKLTVHHIVPFHLAPDLELDRKNLVTLCEHRSYGLNCHLLIGHLGSYRKVNTTVLADAAEWQVKLSM